MPLPAPICPGDKQILGPFGSPLSPPSWNIAGHILHSFNEGMIRAWPFQSSYLPLQEEQTLGKQGGSGLGGRCWLCQWGNGKRLNLR